MRIVIESIPHNHQRYPTAGDWQVHPATNDITILVSETGVNIYNYLLAMHELSEAIWCLAHGVTQREVDMWDIHHEHMHDSDPTNPLYLREPGDDPMAPYNPGHRLGDLVERLMSFGLNADFNHYEAILNDLDNRYGRPKTRISDEATHLAGLSGRLGRRYAGESTATDYGRRSTVVPRSQSAQQAQAQAGDPEDDQGKSGNQEPQTDPRIPRRSDEEAYPVKIPPERPKTGQGEG